MDILSVRILGDTIPKHFLEYYDYPGINHYNKIMNNTKKNTNVAVYCFAHHQQNVQMMAKTLKDKNFSIPIYILGNKQEMSGVSTFEENKKIYRNNHIIVEEIPYEHETINTKIETETIIPFFIERQIKNIILITPTFHSQRAVMTFVSSLYDKGLEDYIDVYSISSSVKDWNNTTKSHQGKTSCSFFDMIQLESSRIQTYTEKGDIQHADTILKYFKKRDTVKPI